MIGSQPLPTCHAHQHFVAEDLGWRCTTCRTLFVTWDLALSHHDAAAPAGMPVPRVVLLMLTVLAFLALAVWNLRAPATDRLPLEHAPPRPWPSALPFE